VAKHGGVPERTVEVGLRHDGRDRPFLLHTPASGPRPAPLVLELHGRGIDPRRFDGLWTGYSALSDEAGFLLAMPAAVGGIWNDGRSGGPRRVLVDDVGYLLAVVDHLVADDAVDPERVYVVGMSNGANMAGRLAWERPERFAAVAQVAGTAATDVVAGPAPAAPVPIIQVHGTRDRADPYAGGRRTGLLMRLLVRRASGPIVGVDAWAARWAEVNGARPMPVEAIGADVTVRRWSGPTPASDLAFYRIEGGGHTWPGARSWMPPHLGRLTRTIDATRVTWEFLSAHRRSADS
jgi:polyhydroxybutyrate depolymerase